MSRPAPPLRFLGAVIGGWILARAAFLTPEWLARDVDPLPPAGGVPAAVRAQVPAARPAPALTLAPAPSRSAFATVLQREPKLLAVSLASLGAARSVPTADTAFAAPFDLELPERTLRFTQQPLARDMPRSPALPDLRRSSPWLLSAWALLRRGSGTQLAPGGLLGGSQIGARLAYRISDQLALSARLYAPVNDTSGAEAAVGVEWQPARSVPLRVLAERRQALGPKGRSAFALTAHGGVSQVHITDSLILDAYGQAGLVGLQSRDPFVDGVARLALPLSHNLKLGTGAWGAAQPGAARLDIGPEVTYRLSPARLSVSASYRVRVAGDARPGSGPAIILSTDF